MKKIFFSVAIIAIAFNANAQDSKTEIGSLKFSVGVEAGLPLGDFKEISSFGIGGSLQGEYVVADNFGLTLNAGYLNFIGKTVTITGLGSFKYPSTSIVPVLAGAKIYFSEQVYGHAQLGVSFFNNGGGTVFTYAPTLGFMPAENIDLALKYQGASKDGGTLSFLGVRLAYGF